MLMLTSVLHELVCTHNQSFVHVFRCVECVKSFRHYLIIIAC